MNRHPELQGAPSINIRLGIKRNEWIKHASTQFKNHKLVNIAADDCKKSKSVPWWVSLSGHHSLSLSLLGIRWDMMRRASVVRVTNICLLLLLTLKIRRKAKFRVASCAWFFALWRVIEQKIREAILILKSAKKKKRRRRCRRRIIISAGKPTHSKMRSSWALFLLLLRLP